LVLLKNDKMTLPFPRNKKVAVVGPHAFTQRDLEESYKGKECISGKSECVRTVGEVFSTLNGPENTFVEKGVDLDSNDSSGIDAAIEAA